MDQKENLIELIKKHIEIERKLIKHVIEMENKIDSAAAKLLLFEMRLDSQKHAGILDEVLKTISTAPSPQPLWDYRIHSYVDHFAIKKTLENHVKMENEVLEYVEQEINNTKDEGLKLLLQHIAEDEKKHHKILEMIIKHSQQLSF